jgi:hypothetical protein
MAAFTNTFDSAQPVGTDPANQLDDYIRDDTKAALKERYGLEHYDLKTGNSDPDNALAQGRHIPGKVSALHKGTTGSISALTGMQTGAVAIDETLNQFKRYSGSTWENMAGFMGGVSNIQRATKLSQTAVPFVTDVPLTYNDMMVSNHISLNFTGTKNVLFLFQGAIEMSKVGGFVAGEEYVNVGFRVDAVAPTNLMELIIGFEQNELGTIWTPIFMCHFISDMAAATYDISVYAGGFEEAAPNITANMRQGQLWVITF